MIPQLRLVVKSLLISAACAQALDAANVTKRKPKCGGFRPSQELPVLDIIGDTATIVGHTPNFTNHSLNVASYSPNITSETDNATSQTNNSTSETDNITNQTINIDNHIERKINEMRKYWSFAFEFDTSVDQIYRHVRPDLFNADTDFLRYSRAEIIANFRRGPIDYTSLNIVFVYRYEDSHEYWENRENNQEWRFSMQGNLGTSSLASENIVRYDDWKKLAAEDGIVISSGTIGEVVHERAVNVESTLPHEFGHWLGLRHTDSEVQVPDDYVGLRPNATDANCEWVNDEISDTPAHVLSGYARKVWDQCVRPEPIYPVYTCLHLKDRRQPLVPDPIFNLMVSVSNYGCPIDGLTIEQKEKAIHVYETWRLSTKQAIENKRIGDGNRQPANNQAQPQPNQHQQENIQPQPNWHQWNAQREYCLRQAEDTFNYNVGIALNEKFNELEANHKQRVREANRYLNDWQYFGWARQEINDAAGTFIRQWNEYKDDRAPHWERYRQMCFICSPPCYVTAIKPGATKIRPPMYDSSD
ncbi:peptidase M43 family protein [Metarhizium robertsii]|uniref:Peptidase M43 family protein n=1 Tax=Metarhizium robertsii TaxID=568076 RepID=A0A0A1UN59_9HYPO|nr:peptidase M43 family protein [Metarhizium robertsii]